MKDDPKNHAKRLGQIPFATKAKAIVEARRPEVGSSAIGLFSLFYIEDEDPPSLCLSPRQAAWRTSTLRRPRRKNRLCSLELTRDERLINRRNHHDANRLTTEFFGGNG